MDFSELSKINERNGAVYNPIPLSSNTQQTTPAIPSTIGNIIIDRNMLMAIEKANGSAGIIDSQKLKKVAGKLREFEKNHYMNPSGYVLSGFDNINSFRVESISVDQNNGTYKVNKQVIAKINGDYMDITAIIHSKVTL